MGFKGRIGGREFDAMAGRPLTCTRNFPAITGNSGYAPVEMAPNRATPPAKLIAGIHAPGCHRRSRKAEPGPWTATGASPPLEHRLALLAECGERFLGVLGFGQRCRLALLVAIAVAPRQFLGQSERTLGRNDRERHLLRDRLADRLRLGNDTVARHADGGDVHAVEVGA